MLSYEIGSKSCEKLTKHGQKSRYNRFGALNCYDIVLNCFNMFILFGNMILHVV